MTMIVDPSRQDNIISNTRGLWAGYPRSLGREHDDCPQVIQRSGVTLPGKSCPEVKKSDGFNLTQKSDFLVFRRFLREFSTSGGDHWRNRKLSTRRIRPAI